VRRAPLSWEIEAVAPCRYIKLKATLVGKQTSGILYSTVSHKGSQDTLSGKRAASLTEYRMPMHSGKHFLATFMCSAIRHGGFEVIATACKHNI